MVTAVIHMNIPDIAKRVNESAEYISRGVYIRKPTPEEIGTKLITYSINDKTGKVYQEHVITITESMVIAKAQEPADDGKQCFDNLWAIQTSKLPNTYGDIFGSLSFEFNQIYKKKGSVKLCRIDDALYTRFQELGAVDEEGAVHIQMESSVMKLFKGAWLTTGDYGIGDFFCKVNYMPAIKPSMASFPAMFADTAKHDETHTRTTGLTK